MMKTSGILKTIGIFTGLENPSLPVSQSLLCLVGSWGCLVIRELAHLWLHSKPLSLLAIGGLYHSVRGTPSVFSWRVRNRSQGVIWSRSIFPYKIYWGYLVRCRWMTHGLFGYIVRDDGWQLHLSETSRRPKCFRWDFTYKEVFHEPQRRCRGVGSREGKVRVSFQITTFNHHSVQPTLHVDVPPQDNKNIGHGRDSRTTHSRRRRRETRREERVRLE